MRPFFILLLLMIFLSCQEEDKLTANAIVDKAIENACNGNCEQAEIEFIFRKVKYKSTRQDGSYILERNFIDSIGAVRDVLTNKGFKRFVNDSVQKLADTIAQKYAEYVNSVHYFAQLPFGLNAPAARKERVGEAKINGAEYYEIQITFNEEGGGTDFEDEFVYWIHKEDFTVDYLAYSYQVNGGGIRFREAYNPRVVKGIRFVNYNNYKPKGKDIHLTELDTYFQKDELELLSKIENENVSVTLLDTE